MPKTKNENKDKHGGFINKMFTDKLEKEKLEWDSIPTELLIIGEKGSGKSTIIKQLRLIQYSEKHSNFGNYIESYDGWPHYYVYEINIENYRADEWFHPGDQKTFLVFGKSNPFVFDRSLSLPYLILILKW